VESLRTKGNDRARPIVPVICYSPLCLLQCIVPVLDTPVVPGCACYLLAMSVVCSGRLCVQVLPAACSVLGQLPL
jgi:hypothetical protein